jgi:CBS domain-containing protein
VTTVPATASVAELVEVMFRERHTGYPVTRNGRIVGLVTLEDAKGVKEVERDAYRVEEVMSTDLITIDPSEDAMVALSRMGEHGVGRLLVMDQGTRSASTTSDSGSGAFGDTGSFGNSGTFGEPADSGEVSELDELDPDAQFAGLITRTDLMKALDIIRSSGSLDAGRSERPDTDGPFPGTGDEGATRRPDDLR